MQEKYHEVHINASAFLFYTLCSHSISKRSSVPSTVPGRPRLASPCRLNALGALILVIRRSVFPWNRRIVPLPGHTIKHVIHSYQLGSRNTCRIRQVREPRGRTEPPRTDIVRQRIDSSRSWLSLQKVPLIVLPNLDPVVIAGTAIVVPGGGSHEACRDSNSSQTIHKHDGDATAGGVTDCHD